MSNVSKTEGFLHSDSPRLSAAVLLLLSGMVGFYHFSESPLWLRVALILASLGFGVAILWYTQLGQKGWHFLQESRVELYKVVWPTRKETMRMTMVVVAIVLAMSLFLWMVDSLLVWLIRSITGY